MTRPSLLVVTTVHQPDDARIRAKLISSLATDWDVTYATRLPGPSDTSGLDWRPLPGGRLRRFLGAARIMLASRWDLVAFHDPELLPVGWVRALLGRSTLFDLHENLPGQIRNKSWLPAGLRPVLAAASRAGLRITERLMTVTLAERGYAGLFREPHPVIANHLAVSRLPAPRASEGFFVYVGDVTEQRGAHLAIAAASGAERPLRLIGRMAPPELGERLMARASQLGVALELVGPLPHGDALEMMARAEVGLSPLLDVPNYRHSLPTKVLEYLAVGIPVVASDLPGTREVLEGMEGVVLVAPGDEAAWVAAGAGWSTRLRLEAGRQSQAVRDRYAWPHEVVLTSYRQALFRPRRPGRAAAPR